MAANLGEDADTTAAITGQLAGALSMVPPAFLSDGMTGWRGSLRICSWAETLYERRSNDEADASAFCGCVSPVIALMAIAAQSPISFACSDEYFASVIAAS